MKMRQMMIAAAGLAFALGQPLFADEMDPAKMSCKDFAAMDADGMMKSTMAMKTAAMEDKMADPAKVKMSDEEVMKMVTKSCDGKPDMMAMDALHPDM